MRYIVRDEFFGGIAYDRVERDYLHLDPLAMRIIKKPTVPLSADEQLVFDTDNKEVSMIFSELNSLGLIESVCFFNNKIKSGMLSAPIRIFLEITYKCPEKCLHCYTNSGKKRTNELNLEEKFSIIDQMCNMGCFRLSIAGGEPLVDRDFFPVVERALANNIDISFSTSGTPITERLAKQIAELDIRTVNISLDGWDEASYEQVRGSGRFKYMVRGIKNLRKYYSNKIAAKCTLMTTNIKHLDRIIKMAEDLEFDVVKFDCIRPSGRAKQTTTLLPTPNEYLESIKMLANIYNCNASKIKIVLPLNPYQKVTKDTPSTIDDLGFGCYAGKESFCITAEGNIQPCTSFGANMYIDGNVRECKLLDVWMSGASMKLFRGLKGSDTCHNCPSYKGCSGGCHLRSFSCYGDVNAIDPYCYERKSISIPQLGVSV
ncbi:MAG: radical SAM protein [Gammaproteobacteria bacterium]|jgi:radical SAM protein with 4Fe4S-binding SPASM domain